MNKIDGPESARRVAFGGSVVLDSGCGIVYTAFVMHNRPIPLGRLHSGQRGRISRIQGHPDHVHRLEEFGLRGGTSIEMFRPGNPCIIRMAGNKICFRADDGVSISVEPVE